MYWVRYSPVTAAITNDTAGITHFITKMHITFFGGYSTCKKKYIATINCCQICEK